MVCVGDWQFKIFSHKDINTKHKFSCTRNAACVHVMCIVAAVHTICEGLLMSLLLHKHKVVNKKNTINFVNRQVWKETQYLHNISGHSKVNNPKLPGLVKFPEHLDTLSEQHS